MLMDSFEVENFRSLRQLKLEKMARVNLLVGKNNSGKTSVLEAIYALTRIEVADWFDLLENNRGIDYSDHDFSSIFYGFSSKSIVQVSASYRDSGRGPKRFRFRLDLVTESNRSRRKERKILNVSILAGTGKPPHRFTLNNASNEDDEAEYIGVSDGSDEFLEEGLPSNIEPRHSARFLSTDIDLTQLSEQLSDIILSKEESTLLSVMQEVEPRITSLVLDSKGQVHFNLGDRFDRLFPINLMGEGIQRLLCVITSIAATAGGFILIDELDNGLHYSALRILWKGILQAAREYDVQIVATTHSVEALRHLTWVLDDEENASFRDDVAAYTLIRANDDTVRSYRHNYGQLEYALEHGIEVRN
jgi:AAA15 family ATPase/GTPase